MTENNYVPHPSDGKLLREIDACRTELSKALHMYSRDIATMDKCATELQDHKPVYVHNIKNSTLTAVMYLRMAQMVLDNIQDDMRKVI